MKESYVEGLASYGGPESCVHIREGGGEGLTGERAGRVSSRVIHAPRLRSREVRGAEAVETCRRPHRGCRIGKAVLAPPPSNPPPRAWGGGRSGVPRQWRRAEGHTGAAALARQSWPPRGHRPRACAETFRTGTGRSRVLLGHAVRREPHQSAS